MMKMIKSQGDVMKKKQMKKTNAMRILEKEQVFYQVHTYAWDEEHSDAHSAAEKVDKPIEKIYKTLVAKGDKTGIVVACIPGESELDLKALASASGNKKVEMLAMKELETVTGYIRGGCSPIGMKKSYPTFIDISAEPMSEIIVSAGKRGVQIELNPQELQKVISGNLADIIMH